MSKTGKTGALINARRDKLMQALRFTLFSASAGILQIAVFTLLETLTAWSYWPCYLPALILSVLWNFTFNRRYTFRSAANVPRAMLLVAVYYVIFTPLSTWWGVALETVGWNEYLILALTMIVNFVTEYLYQRFVVYKDTIDTNDVAKKKAKTNP